VIAGASAGTATPSAPPLTVMFELDRGIEEMMLNAW
jgi:hypothetical protein